MVENNILFLYSLVAIAGIIGAFKSVDWLISTKYRTKDECEKCRKTIFDAINKDRDLLVRLDAKMDLVLENMKESKNVKF
ncbi:MAG: hypothetical protein IJB79_03555 [Candidatus Gastranaerophilales bacterium]|nr:hypothetical protein [Candidatus Gastranaerophilales bacterium]